MVWFSETGSEATGVEEFMTGPGEVECSCYSQIQGLCC